MDAYQNREQKLPLFHRHHAPNKSESKHSVKLKHIHVLVNLHINKTKCRLQKREPHNKLQIKPSLVSSQTWVGLQEGQWILAYCLSYACSYYVGAVCFLSPGCTTDLTLSQLKDGTIKYNNNLLLPLQNSLFAGNRYQKNQKLWACYHKLEISSSPFFTLSLVWKQTNRLFNDNVSCSFPLCHSFFRIISPPYKIACMPQQQFIQIRPSMGFYHVPLWEHLMLVTLVIQSSSQLEKNWMLLGTSYLTTFFQVPKWPCTNRHIYLEDTISTRIWTKFVFQVSQLPCWDKDVIYPICSFVSPIKSLISSP